MNVNIDNGLFVTCVFILGGVCIDISGVFSIWLKSLPLETVFYCCGVGVYVCLA